jgi:two-component system LytT family sensor kinase
MQPDGMKTSRVVALAVVIGVFFTAEEACTDLARGRSADAARDLLNGLQFWGAWLLLTPAVMAALRRWRLDQRPVAHALFMHAATGITLTVVRNMIGIVVFRIGLYLRGEMSMEEALTSTPNPVGFVFGLFTGMLYYCLALGTYTALRYRSSAETLQAELTQSKLDTLRSQLRPHFLFNTLNAISVLVTEDAAKSQQMILRLSTLLRRSLDEEAHEVPLQQELAFVNDYLDIQRERFGDQLIVSLAVDDDVMDARVPVFLLQPLLENAIEHGKSENKCTTIALRAGRERDMLQLTLEDDGPGVGDSALVHEGIGLRNTRARLHHLYGSRAMVKLTAAQENGVSGGTRVEIRIPLQRNSV